MSANSKFDKIIITNNGVRRAITTFDGAIIPGTKYKRFKNPPQAGAGVIVAQTVSGCQCTATDVGSDVAQWNANAIQDIAVSSTSPTTGQVLSYNGTQWVPETVISSGSSISSGSIQSGHIGNNAVNSNNLAAGVAAANLSGSLIYISSIYGNNLSGELIISSQEGIISKVILEGGTIAGSVVELHSPLRIYESDYNDPYLTNNSIYQETTSGLTYRTSGGVDKPFLLDKIYSGNIASGQIGQYHLASGVGGSSVLSGTIQSDQLASGAVLSGHIASGQIGKNHLASGIPTLLNKNASGIQLWESGNVFKGLVVCGGYDFSPPTNGRLRIQSSDFTNTNAIIECTNGLSTAQFGQQTVGYNATIITNTSVAPIEIAANDYSTSKVGIGQQQYHSGKLHVTALSGMVGCVIQNGYVDKDILQLASASGVVLTKVTSSGDLAVKNVTSSGQITCNNLILTGPLVSGMGGTTFYLTDSTNVGQDTLFLDSSNGKLSFKNSGGIVNALY
jgi:hypothetical protein